MRRRWWRGDVFVDVVVTCAGLLLALWRLLHLTGSCVGGVEWSRSGVCGAGNDGVGEDRDHLGVGVPHTTPEGGCCCSGWEEVTAIEHHMPAVVQVHACGRGSRQDSCVHRLSCWSPVHVCLKGAHHSLTPVVLVTCWTVPLLPCTRYTYYDRPDSALWMLGSTLEV